MKPFIPAAAAALLAAAATFALTTREAPSATSKPSVMRTVSGSDPAARLSLLDVRRIGRVVTVKLRLTVVRDPGLLPYYVDLAADGGDDGSADGLRLHDDVGGRTVMPLRDPDGRCSCSRGLDRLSKGDAVAVFARFPAPPAKTLTIDAPGFPPFYDVPVR
jgi:hypothetical protein